MHRWLECAALWCLWQVPGAGGGRGARAVPRGLRRRVHDGAGGGALLVALPAGGAEGGGAAAKQQVRPCGCGWASLRVEGWEASPWRHSAAAKQQVRARERGGAARAGAVLGACCAVEGTALGLSQRAARWSKGWFSQRAHCCALCCRQPVMRARVRRAHVSAGACCARWCRRFWAPASSSRAPPSRVRVNASSVCVRFGPGGGGCKVPPPPPAPPDNPLPLAHLTHLPHLSPCA